MRKVLLTFLTLLLIVPSFFYGQETQEVKSDIDAVSVYLQGARVHRKSKINVKRGRNVLVFPQLESTIDANSIQAAAPGDIVIISVKKQLNYRERPERDKRWSAIKDSLDVINHRFWQLSDQHTVLDKERDMILSNQKLSGEKVPVAMDELVKASDFYRKRMNEIYASVYKIKLERETLTRTQTRLKSEFASLGGPNPRNGEQTHEIVVTLDAPLNSSIFLNLSYYVTGPRWVPRYDLRADDLTKPVDLHYRADIMQNTGKDWKNVALTLSSANPQLGGNKPDLNPWYLSLYDPSTAYGGGSYGSDRSAGTKSLSTISVQETARSKPKKKSKDAYYEADNSTLSDYTYVTQTAVSTQFEIGLPQDIPSDGKEHRVMIREEKLPADFQHYTVPKMDKTAFLMAQVTGWEGLDLLAGETNIYLEGAYIGKSYLNPAISEDTLLFSLGRDPKVVVQREQLKDYKKSVFLGLNKQKTYAYEITLRNTKKAPIKVSIEDQIPISQDEKIVVRLEDSSDAKLDADTGFLTWDLELEPAETKKVRFIYWVKYPKKMRVSGL